MSIVAKLIIGGWSTTIAMVGLFALDESGKLFKIRRRIALWLETAAAQVGGTREESLQGQRERAF